MSKIIHSSLLGAISIKDAVPKDKQNVIWIWDLAGQITAGDYFEGKCRDSAKNYAETDTRPTHWMPWPDNWPNDQSGPEDVSTSHVPFHELPTKKNNIYDGIGGACENGSAIEVWKIEGDSSLYIELRRKLDDGKTSLLKFGISLEAASALMLALQMQIYPGSKIIKL